MPQSTLLIGDIGGTHARFALADSEQVGFAQALTLQCADYLNPVAAMRAYLEQVSASEPTGICIAAAGPVVDEAVRLTNNDWLLDAAELRCEFATSNVRLLNDFEAVSRSIPHLSEADVLSVGETTSSGLGETDFTIAVIGPGTGLGTGGVCRRDRECYPLISEGGQSGFAPETARQLKILADLRECVERVTVETLVSGPGLENVYAALCRLQQVPATDLSAQDIFASGLAGKDARAEEAVSLFFEMFGQIAGDLALTLGALDGVYIAGGILRRYPEALQASRFRARFEAKGSHREFMQRIPTWLVTYAEPGLLGAASCVSEH